MTCKETKAHIQAFINKEIGLRDVGEFLEHLDECASCRDELETEFLIKEGLTRLEAGEVFNFEKDLQNLLNSQQKRVNLFSWLKYLVFAFFVMFVLVILYFIF